MTIEQKEYYYGTFQGVANYYPPPQPQLQPYSQATPQTITGFPQPVPPPCSTVYLPTFYPNGYQTVAGYSVVEGGRPFALEEHRRLPCCGIGMGWFLFVLGFFLGGIPWYVGSFLLLFSTLDIREKPGYIACAIASLLAIVAITLGVTEGTHSWYH